MYISKGVPYPEHPFFYSSSPCPEALLHGRNVKGPGRMANLLQDERTHSGKYCFGKIPLQIFQDSGCSKRKSIK